MLTTAYYTFSNLTWTTTQLLWQIVVNLNNTRWNFLLIFGMCLVLTNFFTKLYLYLVFSITCGMLCKYSQLDYVPQLLIGYNNVHPLLFYGTVVMLYTVTTCCEAFNKVSTTTIFSVGVCALLLGGYWGLNNTAWGYFWVNDFIELILLAVCILSLFRLHCRNLVVFKISGYLYLFYLVFLIIGSRYGLVFTRHSFFDITKLNNVGILYFVSLCRVDYVLVIKLLMFFSTCIIFFWVLCLIRTICLQSFINIYSLIFHITILVLLLTWLKQAPLHYSTSGGRHLYIMSPLFFNKIASGFLFQFSKYKTTIYMINTALFVHKKFFILKQFAIVLYSTTIYLVLLLVSIVKIYDSWVQN